MASGQMKRTGPSGKVNSYSDYIEAMNYFINKALPGKEPTEQQKEAVDRLNQNDVRRAKADAKKEVQASESKSTNSSTPPTERTRVSMERRYPLTNIGRVNPISRPVSERDRKELAARAAERRAGSGSSRPSTVDTRSKKPIAKRIMEALGDKRTMERATKDREMTERMEKETMGRKKGGMGQKKKAPVKKAYGGMVKKKQGGSANKVNMKAGFTRRGCSKG